MSTVLGKRGLAGAFSGSDLCGSSPTEDDLYAHVYKFPQFPLDNVLVKVYKAVQIDISLMTPC